MSKKRRNHSPDFKSKVTLAALKGDQTASELSKQNGNYSMIVKWKKHSLSRARRCELLGIPRSSSYYQPQPVTEKDLIVMRLIDEIHTDKPFLGSRRIVDALDKGVKRTVSVYNA